MYVCILYIKELGKTENKNSQNTIKSLNLVFAMVQESSKKHWKVYKNNQKVNNVF